VPTSNLALTSTNGTIANFTSSTANITLGTIPTLTAGTTTGTAGIFTSGTIATLNSTTGTIPTLVATTLITTGTGTAAAPAIVPTGDNNTGLFFPAADTIAFSEGGAEAMRIDSSGNVGVGTASPASKLHINGGMRVTGEVSTAGASALAMDFLSGNSRLISCGSDASTQGGFSFISLNSTSSIATERLRIDSSGNVGIGTNSPSVASGLGLVLNGGASQTRLAFKNTYTGDTSTDGVQLALVAASSQFLLQNRESDGIFAFETAGTERLRIDSSGSLLVGATSAQSSERLLALNDSATNPSFIAYSPSATFTGYVARLFADRNTSNSTYNFLSCVRVASAGDVFIIRDSGNAVNTNNSYGAISDIKLKENIENASSQWDDIKSIQVRKFSFKNDEEHKRMLGLVAQEVELISPNLVETVIDRDKDGSDLGTTTKEVKYSVLYMKAVKALQEAMVRIEALEAKVTALEAA
jgi:hypothetical protein